MVQPVTASTSPMKVRMEPTNSTASAAASKRDAPGPPRAEPVVAAVLFVIAYANFLLLAARLMSPSARSTALPGPAASAAWFMPAALLVVLLGGAYLGLSVSIVRLRLARALSAGAVGVFVPPVVLLAALALYCRLSGLSLGPRAAIYAAYLLLPALIALRRARTPIPILLAAAALWLPLQFRLLPPVPIPAGAGGYDASRLLGLVNGLCLFLVSRPIGGIGFTFILSRRDVGRAGLAFAIFAVVALPIGLGTRFLAWNPRLGGEALAAVPWLIYLGTAIPEEFLFRGVIQNVCHRAFGPAAGLAIASVVFGLAHLPDWRYALLATFAGVAYGSVYWRTGKITASAITHTLVDWVWVVLLRA